MSSVVVSGYYGFSNAGDEAMLTAMIEALTDVDPHIRITVISGDPENTRRRHGVDAVYRMNYPAIARRLVQADLLISGGGSLLQDVTSGRSLHYYLSIMLLAQLLGKPVMLYAQGIGPVRGGLARAAMRQIVNRTDLITVRDEGSLTELAALGITAPPVYLTADSVLTTHPIDRQIGRNILRRHGVEGVTPRIGVSVREWKAGGRYKEVLAAALDRMSEELGARIVFLPMQYPDDLTASQAIADRMTFPATVLPECYTNGELLSLVGNMDLLVGIRLHALIFAAVMHTPLVGISYDPKIDGFLETLGETPVGSLDTLQPEQLLEAVRLHWQQRKQNNPEREERLTGLWQKAFRNAELAVALLGGELKKP
ncbi:MAG TPA: polysaccharide pyruvyl transferase CsaB [Patescibacteria group bacterium]|nr:polysaccharide pyruvyl transferase CsaB [Patescibacteria group bacterium]